MTWGLSRREAALVLVTVLWGGTFLAVQVALQWASPFALVGVRFCIAAVLLGLVLWWRGELKALNRFEVRAGIIVGVWVFLGFGLQTAGLQTIESSKSGFLTALYVPFVPLVLLLWKRQWPTPWAWAAVGLAVGRHLRPDGRSDGRFHLERGGLADRGLCVGIRHGNCAAGPLLEGM